MTTLAPPPVRGGRGTRLVAVAGVLAAGLLAGAAWGVAARGFMRLLAEYPEFSWSGTLLIVLSAAVIGGCVAIVRWARRSGRSRWWRVLGLPFLLLFVGQGAVLFPGTVGVVMILDRRRWLAVPGAALVGVSLWLCTVSPWQTMTARQWSGMVVLSGCVGVLGWAAHELVRRWRPGPTRGSGEPVGGGGEPSPEPERADDVLEGGRSRSFAP